MSDNRMYCYVCWSETMLDIYHVEALFWYEKDAKAWKGKNKSKYYKKMPIS